MATPTEKRSQTPYVPVTSNTEWFKGIDPVQRQFTGQDATQDQRQAYDLTEAQFGPSRIAAQRRLSKLGADRQYETGVQQNFGEQHDKSLQNISQQLQEQLGSVTDRTQQLHGGASKVIGDAYGRAQSATQGASQDVLAALADQMGRLGLEEAGRDPNAEVSQMGTDMSGRHAISGAGAVGNAENLGASMTSIAANRQGDAAQEWAGKRTELAQQVMSGINQINRDYADKRDEVFAEIQGIEAARGQALNSTLKQVIEDRLERERQSKLDRLSEEMARRGMAVQEGYLGLSGQRFGLEEELGRGNLDISRGQLGLSREQLAFTKEQYEDQKAQLEAQMEAANSPYERARIQMELDNMELENQKIEAEIAEMNNPNSGGNQDYDKMSGARRWMQSQVGYSPEAQQQYLSDFENFLTQAMDEAYRSGSPEDATLKQYIDAATVNNPEDRRIFNELWLIYTGNR